MLELSPGLGGLGCNRNLARQQGIENGGGEYMGNRKMEPGEICQLPTKKRSLRLGGSWIPHVLDRDLGLFLFND